MQKSWEWMRRRRREEERYDQVQESGVINESGLYTLMRSVHGGISYNNDIVNYSSFASPACLPTSSHLTLVLLRENG